jgi:uncharacterized membrane protein YcjF (UPF0283 family)
MKKFIIAAIAFSPVLAFAQNQPTLNNATQLTKSFGQLVASALPILVALAVLAFFYGLVKFIFSQGNAEAKGEGKMIMIWGGVAIVVMVSIWGIVNFVANDLGINGNVTPNSINLPGVGGRTLGN